MIAERVILCAVEPLQQSGCGVALEIAGELVDLVKQHERIHALALPDCVDDSAGHCADIGFSVAADLRLIADTAERHTDIVSAERPCNRLCNGGFTDTGRSDKADDLPGELRLKRMNAHRLKHTLFHAFEPVMLAVEQRLRFFDIELFLCIHAPRQAQHRFEVVVDDISLLRTGGHFCKLIRFFSEFILDLVRSGELFNLRQIFLHIVAVAVAEFLGNHTLLLTEIQFPLPLVDTGLHAVLQLCLNFQHLIFADQHRIEHRQAEKQAPLLQHELAVVVIEIEVRPDALKEHFRLFLCEHHFCEFPRHFARKPAICGKGILDRIYNRLHLGGRGFHPAVCRQRLIFGGPEAVILRRIELQQLCAGDAFNQNSCALPGAHDLPDLADHADAVKIAGFGLHQALVALRNQNDASVMIDSFINSLFRFASADLEIHDHMRICDKTAQRNDRERNGNGLRCLFRIGGALFFLLHIFFQSALRGGSAALSPCAAGTGYCICSISVSFRTCRTAGKPCLRRRRKLSAV